MKWKRKIAALLSAVMLLSMLPVQALAAETGTPQTHAAAGNKTIMMGTSGIQGGGTNSYVWFGNYGQSNGTNEKPEGDVNVDYLALDNPQNEKGKYWPMQPIQWRVLAGQDSAYTYTDWNDSKKPGLLLLSETNLDVYQFDKNNNTNNWSESPIRSWLNDTGSDPTGFYNVAFDDKESMAVGKTKVETNGTSSNDHIFLLSEGEARNANYGFSDDPKRKTVNTEYIHAGGRTAHNSIP